MPPIRTSPHRQEFDPRYDEEDAGSTSRGTIIPGIPDFAAEHRQSRPTLSDIDVLPRRRLRDGSTSTSTSTSRSSGSLLQSLSRPSSGNVTTRFGALREQSLQRARNGVSTPMSIKSSPSASPPRSIPSQRTKKRSASVISISSDDGIELIEPPKGGWTTKEKGKGRAIAISPSSLDSGNDPLKEARSIIPGFKDDEETALGQYSCPICLSRPSQPVMTPCGHLMCGACLHLTLLTSIIRSLPGALNVPAPDTAEGSYRYRLNIREAVARQQPKYTHGLRSGRSITTLNDVNRLSWVGSDPPGNVNELALRMFEDPKLWDQSGLLKPGSVDRGGWLLDGPCPVCRKELNGGLGPRGYGTVIHLEPRKF